MKAGMLKEFGSSIENFEVVETATPKPEFKEVLSKVFATSVNPLNYQLNLGDYNNELTLPVITGYMKSIIHQKFLMDKETMHNIT